MRSFRCRPNLTTALIFSVLELENSLGGDPGPGLGADSDFDRKQLEKVGVGWKRFSASLANVQITMIHVFGTG